MSKDYGAAVSQKGYDVKTCDDRFLVYSSAFQNLKIYNTQSVNTTVPADVGVGFQDYTAATNDVITSAGHGLNNGDKIMFLIDSGCAGLNDHDIYYVINKATDTFKVSATQGGSAIDITSSGSGYWQTAPNRITITHSLGYLAPLFVIFTGSTNMGRNFNSLFSYFGNSTFGSNCRQYANKTEIDVYSWDGDSGDTFYFTVMQFLDDFSSVSARSINSGTTSGASSTDYGIRASKDGYDVKTCTDEQCSFSSSFFSQIVHMKGSTTDETVAHSLGYIPNFITYIKGNDVVGDYLYYDGYFSTADSSNLNTGSAGTDTVYYIIFKDKING